MSKNHNLRYITKATQFVKCCVRGEYILDMLSQTAVQNKNALCVQ